MMTECRGGGDPYSYSPPACIIFKDMWSKMIQEKLKEVKKNTIRIIIYVLDYLLILSLHDIIIHAIVHYIIKTYFDILTHKNITYLKT